MHGQDMCECLYIYMHIDTYVEISICIGINIKIGINIEKGFFIYSIFVLGNNEPLTGRFSFTMRVSLCIDSKDYCDIHCRQDP